MTVLVTGGAGYIGSHMVHALAEAGESVVVIDNLSTGFSNFLPEGVPLFIGDAGDENLVEGVIAQHGVESIIHFAGSVVVPDSMRDPLGYYRNNTMTTQSLLKAAVKGGVKRFIFSSTAAVYGNPDQMPVPEHAPTRPMSPYGSSKLMTEIMLHDVAAAHDMSYVVLRYFNVAGADPQGRTGLATTGATHLLKIAVEAATGQRAKIDVFGTDYPTPDGSAIRDFIHVSDLAQAHRAALSYLRDGGSSVTLGLRQNRLALRTQRLRRPSSHAHPYETPFHPIPAVDCHCRPRSRPGLVAPLRSGGGGRGLQVCVRRRIFRERLRPGVPGHAIQPGARVRL